LDILADRIEEMLFLKVTNLHIECDQRILADVGGSIHNWLLAHGIRYLVVDLQDEKDIPVLLITELLSLRRRWRIPFAFVGVMQKIESVLKDYGFYTQGGQVFFAPEDALDYLREAHQPLLQVDTQAVIIDEIVFSAQAKALASTEEVEPEDAEA
jgi:hypothetical protein